MELNAVVQRIGLRLVALAVAGGFTSAAHGALYHTWSGSQAIPDGNPNGFAQTIDVTDTGLQVSGVSFAFTISGGWNGDLYAYLTHVSADAQSSQSLVLLNRVGVANGSGALAQFGYSGTGFNNITLRDGTYANIHSYGGDVLNVSPTAGGTYKPDGQTTNPLGDPTSFSAGGGNATFGNTFGGTDPSGTWTLFFADLSSGDNLTLENWTLDITAVPEPVNVALGIFGGVFVVVILARTRRVRNRLHQWRVAIVQWIDAV